MSWIGMLCEVYDNCASEIGKRTPNGSVLFPVAHTTVEAAVEVVIDGDGNFVRARRVEKEEATTLVPATIDSETRSGRDPSPMPLCDKIQYLAGGFQEGQHAAYMESLGEWAGEPGVPSDVRAIYRYLERGTLVQDLKGCDAFGSESEFARFVVRQDAEGEVSRGVWEKEEVIQGFIDHYVPSIEERGLDYVTGEEAALVGKLPSKIRNRGDKAKLISSNDKDGYTFRGRFRDAGQAVGIGYLSAQKSHSALRWLIAKQGYRNGSESIVCFSDGRAVPPDPCSFSLFEEAVPPADTRESYARQVNLAIRGYRARLRDEGSSRIAVMSVDTADSSLQGRLAINYYAEMPGDAFLDNLERWQNECAWELGCPRGKGAQGEGKGRKRYIGAPLPRDIALAAYGVERGNGALEADEKVIKKSVDRILPCITERKPFPRDLMRAAARNASEPHRFSGHNARRILTIACALIRKCQIDGGKEVYDMALNRESEDRSYLFGRLLAIAERLEERANYEDGVERETNARKYWSTYVRKPAKTWAVIYDRILPYMSRLSGKQRFFYSKLFAEVLGKLEDTGAYGNEPLDEKYLLGYYSQYEELWKSAREKEENGNGQLDEQD